MKVSNNPLDVQVGGGHYKDFPIQPIEFIVKNKIPFIEGNIIKYISRHRHKNGIEDVKKVKHYCDLLLALDYDHREDATVAPVIEKTPEPFGWDLTRLADHLKKCLTLYGEDMVEKAIEPVLEAWEAMKPKDEDEVELREVVEVLEREPEPEVRYVEEPCIEEPYDLTCPMEPDRDEEPRKKKPKRHYN